MSPKTAFKMIVAAVKDFGADGATTLAAAVSFYTALSLAPVLVILMYIMGIAGAEAQETMISEIQNLVGPRAGDAIRLVIRNAATEQDTGFISALVGTATLLFSSTVVFAQLQYAMNQVWNVKAKPHGGAIWGWLRKRLLSLGMVAGIGFLLLVSLVVSAAIRLVFGEGSGGVWKVLDLAISLAVYSAAFAIIFKVLPDVKITWRDVSVGAIMTAILFTAGKWAIGTYLGYSSVGSAYGAAGSVVVLLVWVYYSALIVFFGAELTQAYARCCGRQPPPEEHAAHDPQQAAKKTSFDEPDKPKPDIGMG